MLLSSEWAEWDRSEIPAEKRRTPGKAARIWLKSPACPKCGILEWVNRADLYRVKGVAGQYSDLLEQAGVDTAKELAQRNPKNLLQTLLETNERCHLVRKLPTEGQIKNWVKYAKTLKRVVEY